MLLKGAVKFVLTLVILFDPRPSHYQSTVHLESNYSMKVTGMQWFTQILSLAVCSLLQCIVY